jgi:NitT/TauT family transport system substrate-binding protein
MHSRIRPAVRLAFAFALGLGLCTPALAQDKLKVAISQKGLWDTAVPYFAEQRGFFKKEGLDISYIWTGGGTETLQAVTTRSVDMATGTALLGVIAAYSKGAPLRVVRSEILGAPESFWMVKKDSPIKSVKDFNGKKISFSRPGSTTNLILLTMMQHYHVKPILVSTGAISASRTMFMTGQIDIGWSIPPFNIDLVKSGQARIVFRATDVPELQHQTIRVNVVNTDALKAKRRAIEKFNRGYDKALAWMYDKPDEAAAAYAKFANVTVDIAKEVPDFYPRASLEKVGLVGLDKNVEAAIKSKFISKPLTKAQEKELVQIVETK